MKKSLGARTIIYPAPVLIIGTYDKDGKPNAMNVAWGGFAVQILPVSLFPSERQRIRMEALSSERHLP